MGVRQHGAGTHVFGPGDLIRVFSPGGTLPLATMSLAGVSLPPQLESTLMVSLAGLPLGPYTVETTWLDPATNVITNQRHGIQAYYGHADLNLPGGHVIPAGGALPVQVGLIGFPVPSAPLYAFCVGILPGSTPVPGVGSVPLVLDAAVTASITDGIGGLLVNNIGSATLVPFHPLSYAGTYSAWGIGVTHPGPTFSGLTVRGAVVAYDPATGQFAASQGEDLLVQ